MKVCDCLPLSEGIYKHNKMDPSNPEVLVQGVGRYDLHQVENNVQKKIEDLAKTAAKATDAADWGRVQSMIDHAAMVEMIKTIVAAKKEIEEQDNKRQENT